MKDLKWLSRHIDVSAVKTEVTMADIDQMINTVKRYNCICASPMPWATKYTINQLKDYPETVVTGVVSFPSGSETTFIKEAATKELISLGCKEIDMVMNVSAFLSGEFEYVKKDISKVVAAANGIPVKVILEIAYLTDDQIRRAASLGVAAGAAYIKTGTGWGPKPTTIDSVRIIKKEIGNAAKIKAAGGIRDLDTMLAMYEAGCDRFGLGVRTVNKVFDSIFNEN